MCVCVCVGVRGEEGRHESVDITKTHRSSSVIVIITSNNILNNGDEFIVRYSLNEVANEMIITN